MYVYMYIDRESEREKEKERERERETKGGFKRRCLGERERERQGDRWKERGKSKGEGGWDPPTLHEPNLDALLYESKKPPLPTPKIVAFFKFV